MEKSTDAPDSKFNAQHISLQRSLKRARAEIDRGMNEAKEIIIEVLKTCLVHKQDAVFKKYADTDKCQVVRDYSDYLHDELVQSDEYNQLCCAHDVLYGTANDLAEWSDYKWGLFSKMVPNVKIDGIEDVEKGKYYCDVEFIDTIDVVQKKLLESEWYGEL